MKPAWIEHGFGVASRLARELGLGPAELRLLGSDNHLVLQLGPIVAKVRRAEDGSPAAAVLAREVAVARHLADVGAPVAPPSSDPPAGPHFRDGVAVTLWRFADGRPATAAHAAQAATALKAVHEGLASFPGTLPPFTDSLDGCVATLEDSAAAPRLAANDRAFLLAEHRRLRDAFDRAHFTPTPLHGDARLGNTLMTDEGVIWLDFEAACLGPRERDLTQFPPAVLADFEPYDRRLLHLLRELGGACVAVWCWADDDPSPVVSEAADYHLAQLRRRARRRAPR